MLKKIFAALAVLIIGLCVYVGLKSPDYRIQREVQIHAPAELIFEHINDAHKFNTWDPWVKIDPNIKMTFTGPAAGVGAIVAWDGDSKVGAGQSQVTESVPAKLVRMRLDYTRPFASTSFGEFTLQSEGENTRVTWSNSGKNTFAARFVCLFMNMDNLIGGTFEKGLADLKSITETEAKAAPSTAAAPALSPAPAAITEK